MKGQGKKTKGGNVCSGVELDISVSCQRLVHGCGMLMSEVSLPFSLPFSPSPQPTTPHSLREKKRIDSWPDGFGQCFIYLARQWYYQPWTLYTANVFLNQHKGIRLHSDPGFFFFSTITSLPRQWRTHTRVRTVGRHTLLRTGRTRSQPAHTHIRKYFTIIYWNPNICLPSQLWQSWKTRECTRAREQGGAPFCHIHN